MNKVVIYQARYNKLFSECASLQFYSFLWGKKKYELDMQELTCEPEPGEEICIKQPVSQ